MELEKFSKIALTVRISKISRSILEWEMFTFNEFNQFFDGIRLECWNFLETILERFSRQCMIMIVYAHHFARITNATYILCANRDAKNASQTIYGGWMNEWARATEYWCFNISHNAIFDGWFDVLMCYVSYSLFRLWQAVCAATANSLEMCSLHHHNKRCTPCHTTHCNRIQLLSEN